MTENEEIIVNPFLDGRPIEIVEFHNELNIALSSGGLNKPVKFTASSNYAIDRDSKTSIYWVTGMFERLIAMPNSAKNLYFYIVMHLKKGKDVIELQHGKLCELLDITERTYYSSLNYLIDHGFVQKKYARTYWINPHFFFNGQRYKDVSKMYGEEHVKTVAIINPGKHIETVTEPVNYGFDNGGD